jgi:hypothetical protein
VARARVALLPELPLGAGTGITPSTPQPQQVPQPSQPSVPAGTPIMNASVPGTQTQVGTR